MTASAPALRALALTTTTNTSTTTTAASWCGKDQKQVLLSSCDDLCGANVPCVKYPSDGSTCSEDGGNLCTKATTADNSICTFQCLPKAYNAARLWFVFIKEPSKTDGIYVGDDFEKGLPAAPIDAFQDLQLPSGAQYIQITGYEDLYFPKGKFKSVSFPSDQFTSIPSLGSFMIMNVDLSALPQSFIPTSPSSIFMENCNLTTFPNQIGTMKNLLQLSLARNNFEQLPAMPTAMSRVKLLNLSYNSLEAFDWELTQVNHLLLEGNKLKEFPMSIFKMPKLVSVGLAGNSFSNVQFTKEQLDFLKRLASNSTLGLEKNTRCGQGATANQLGSDLVCVGDRAISGGGSSADSSSSKSSTNTVLIVVVIVLAVVVVLGVIGFVFYRRKKKSQDEERRTSQMNPYRPSRPQRPPYLAMGNQDGKLNASDSTTGSDYYNNNANSDAYGEIHKYQEELSMQSEQRNRPSSSTTSALSMATTHADAEHAYGLNKSIKHIDPNEIIFTRTVAKGAFGEVWLAHLGREFVAVKRLLLNERSSIETFVGELNILANLNHPRIVGLVGAAYSDDSFGDLMIVTEYMDSGDLLTVLRQRGPDKLTWENAKGEYCIQVAEAISYLHSLDPPLIHRDLKSRNVLIDSIKGAKLTDFGESRERTYNQTMTAGVGTARWVAPEIILGEDYTELADIYSFGVLLSELDTHHIPFEGQTLDESTIVQQVALGKLRPDFSDTCPELIRQLAHECLQFDASLRPPAVRIFQMLQNASFICKKTSTL